MIYICLSIFLCILPTAILSIYNNINQVKFEIEIEQKIEQLKIEHKREYQHLLNNIKNIDNFLKHEK